MASTSETGHDKNVANFKTLIIDCQSIGTSYNPSNPNITITAMQTVYTNGSNALTDVGTKENTVQHTINTRDVVFLPLKSLATQIMGALEASGANAQTMLNAKTINRKIQGSRATKKAGTSNTNTGSTTGTTPTSSTPANPTTQPAPSSQRTIGTPVIFPHTIINISVSQQSFDKLVASFVQLVDYVAQYPSYNPNEPTLKIAALNITAAGFTTANNNVKTAQAASDIAIANRTKILYDPTTGLVQITKEVKAYVKSAFGASSPQYKQVKAIRFKTEITRSHKKKK